METHSVTASPECVCYLNFAETLPGVRLSHHGIRATLAKGSFCAKTAVNAIEVFISVDMQPLSHREWRAKGPVIMFLNGYALL